jgi:hypothetical protein
MKTIIKTQPYNFVIELAEENNYYTFEIIAKCNVKKIKSRITNVNFIISQLISPFIKFEDYESTIDVNKRTGRKIYRDAITLFNDDRWMNKLYLELQDDREAGEWEWL